MGFYTYWGPQRVMQGGCTVKETCNTSTSSPSWWIKIRFYDSLCVYISILYGSCKFLHSMFEDRFMCIIFIYLLEAPYHCEPPGQQWNCDGPLCFHPEISRVPAGFENFFHPRLPLPSSVIKHGVLENPQTEWRFLARKITDFYGPYFPTRHV